MSYYIGAKDRIDQLLVQKYANLQANNVENNNIMPVDKFWKLMGLVAQYEKTILEIKNTKKA